MKKISKICLSLFLISLFLLTYVNAANINMFLENYSPSNTTNIVEEENQVLSNDISNTDNTVNVEDTNEDNSSPRVTTTSNANEDEFFTVENILSIFIIVIGILLIFLAIAILIRLK